MAFPFLDTNILLRHLLQDHPVFARRATAILARIEQGDLHVQTSDIVIFETVFTLQRSYKRARAAIASGLLPLIELSGVHLPGKRMYRRVFELYLQTSLGFADCYHVALMERLGTTEILSFDMDFDHIPGITRRQE